MRWLHSGWIPRLDTLPPPGRRSYTARIGLRLPPSRARRAGLAPSYTNAQGPGASPEFIRFFNQHPDPRPAP
jgi:hypothetical protein